MGFCELVVDSGRSRGEVSGWSLVLMLAGNGKGGWSEVDGIAVFELGMGIRDTSRNGRQRKAF